MFMLHKIACSPVKIQSSSAGVAASGQEQDQQTDWEGFFCPGKSVEPLEMKIRRRSLYKIDKKKNMDNIENPLH